MFEGKHNPNVLGAGHEQFKIFQFSHGAKFMMIQLPILCDFKQFFPFLVFRWSQHRKSQCSIYQKPIRYSFSRTSII